jgi:glycolate oxidase FAD binding subunit
MEPALQSFIDRIQAAAAESTPLRIQAGGTKAFYGMPAHGQPLDVRGFSGIVDYEPSELVVTARAGTSLAELEATLAESGQCLPFEPPHFGSSGAATVGGMVAAGLSGPARASVGAVRDYVLGAHLVNGRGALLQFGGQVMKNVAGYDVSRLLAGSMGVLGLITQVSLKVLPVAPAEATLRFACTQAEALAMLHGWGGQPLPLNASCWLQENADAKSGTLYVRLRGAKAAVQAACGLMGGERIDAAGSDAQGVAADWHACRDQQLPWFAERPAGHGLWRLSLPQTAPVLALESEIFGTPLVEWHGGQRWYRAPLGDAHVLRRLRDAASAVGGNATLFMAEGADQLSAEGQSDARNVPLSAPLARIHQGLKAEFDPAGVFNPGRLLAGV